MTSCFMELNYDAESEASNSSGGSSNCSHLANQDDGRGGGTEGEDEFSYEEVDVVNTDEEADEEVKRICQVRVGIKI